MPQQESKAPSKAQAPADVPEFISEGNRAQIEETGSAWDPFNGRTLTKADLSAYQNRKQ